MNFAEYSFLMNFGNYQIVATVLPKNTENQNLKYEIINNTYSGLTINENTGLITYVDNGNNGSCNSFTVKVSAQDGSGVYITRKLLMEKPLR